MSSQADLFAAKYEHGKELARLRQRKYHADKKDTINTKRRDKNDELKRLRKQVIDMQNEKAAMNFTPVHSPPQEQDLPTPVHSPPEPDLPVPKRGKKIQITLDYYIDFINRDKNYVAMKDDGKKNKEHIHVNAIKTLSHLLNCDDFNKCIPKFGQVEEAIRNGKQKSDPTKEYSINSRKSQVQVIYYGINKIPELIINNETKQKYKKLLDLYKVMSYEYNDERMIAKNHSVIEYTAYMQRLKDVYGGDSKEFLIGSLYGEVTARDDFDLTIVNTLVKSKNKSKNYVVVPRGNGKCTIVLNHYKTVDTYDTFSKELSTDLSELIRAYIQKHKIDYDATLFMERDGLSKFITNMHKKIGLEKGINTIRHIVISSQIKTYPNMSAAEKLEFAENAMHQHVTHLRYGRIVE